MQNKCIFIKDPFQSTAYRCTEDWLCILNFHVKTSENIAIQALSPISKTNWICRCTWYLTRSRDNVCIIPFPISSHSSQNTGLILYVRMREKKELYKLCQVTLIHRKGHKLILSFLGLKARYLWASILEALI